jgi:hypothetical protein
VTLARSNNLASIFVINTKDTFQISIFRPRATQNWLYIIHNKYSTCKATFVFALQYSYNISNVTCSLRPEAPTPIREEEALSVLNFILDLL